MKLIRIILFIASFLYVAYGKGMSITLPGNLLFAVSFAISLIGSLHLVKKSFTELTKYD